jgi:hypothetical protein
MLYQLMRLYFTADDNVAEQERRHGPRDSFDSGCRRLFRLCVYGGNDGLRCRGRISRDVRSALEQKTPFACIAASAGARMQESVYSLMQMAK